MPIYVDEYPGEGWGKWQGGGHLLTSNIEELHAFAVQLGLKLVWFQDKKSAPHYDLTKNKRLQAINQGAIPIDFGEFPDDMLWCGKDGYETQLERQKRISDAPNV